MAKGDRSFWDSNRPCPLGLLQPPHRHETTRRTGTTPHAFRSLRIRVIHTTALHPRRSSHPIERVEHPTAATVKYMGANLGGRYILVPQQVLHRADVVTGLEPMGGKGMPESVRRWSEVSR